MQRNQVATDLLHQFETGAEGFLSQIVMGDETWVHYFEPESKWLLIDWCRMTSQQRRRNSSMCHPLKRCVCICARPYVILCTMEAIADFGQTVLPHSPYNPGLAPSDNHLCGPSEKACKDTIMPLQSYCWILCTIVCRGEREQLLLGRNTCFCSKMEEDCWQIWRLYLKLTLPLAVV